MMCEGLLYNTVHLSACSFSYLIFRGMECWIVIDLNQWTFPVASLCKMGFLWAD